MECDGAGASLACIRGRGFVTRPRFGNRHASGNQFMCSPYSPESGVRTFTGSRSASVDATFSDHADDCTDNGFPRPQGYVMNLTALAHGEPPVHDWFRYVNFSGMADGLVVLRRSMLPLPRSRYDTDVPGLGPISS